MRPYRLGESKACAERDPGCRVASLILRDSELASGSASSCRLSFMGRSHGGWVALAVVTLLVVAPLLTGCKASRVGAPCRTGFARDNTHVLTCRRGRFVRLMTFGEYLRLLDRLQSNVRNIDFSSATLPAGACNYYSWQSTNPIPLTGGVGNSDPYTPGGDYSGVSVNRTEVVGYADVDGDGREEAVLEIGCAGGPYQLCCAGRSSLSTFVIVVRKTGAGLALVGGPIVGLPISGADAGIRSVRLEGTTVVTTESVTYPEIDGDFPDQERRYSWNGSAWQVR